MWEGFEVSGGTLCCVTPTVTDGSFQDSGGHSSLSWDVFPPFSPTMHYLVTEASQALLSLRWWMVLGAPQWPQWLASADKALNDFSRNLIAPQSPRHEQATAFSAIPSCCWNWNWISLPFSLGLTFDPFKFFLKKSTAKEGKKQSQKQSKSPEPTLIMLLMALWLKIKFIAFLFSP